MNFEEIENLSGEELFQAFLTLRTKLSNKGKRVNTDLAVSNLRAKLKRISDIGYPPDALVRQSMYRSWLGIFPLRGIDPKQTHLKAPESLAPIVNGIVGQHKVPQPRTYQEQHDRANKIRGQAANIAKMKKILGI